MTNSPPQRMVTLRMELELAVPLAWKQQSDGWAAAGRDICGH